MPRVLLVAEAIPALDLAPTWTAAVLLVTGRKRAWSIAVAVAFVAAALLLSHLRR